MLGPSLPCRSRSIFNQVAQSEYISPSQVAYSHQSNLIRGDHGQINPTKPYHHLRRFRLSRVALRASPISRPWLDAPEFPRDSTCRLLQQCQRQLHRLRPFGTTGRLESRREAAFVGWQFSQEEIHQTRISTRSRKAVTHRISLQYCSGD